MFKKKNTKASAFSTSDFKVMAVTTGTVDVGAVSGISNYASSTNYNASISTTVTEVSASVDAVLTSVVTSSGHSLSIPTTLPVTITASNITNAAPTEVMETINTANSGFTAGDTLALVTAVSAYEFGSLTVDVSSGGYTLTDIGAGILTAASLPVSGTVDAAGAWTLDFTNQEELTNGTIISGDYEVSYLETITSTPIVITHTILDGSPFNGTASGVLSAIVTDPTGVTGFGSISFELSANEIPNNNPWKGRGALPGETTLETTGRFIDEGVI